MAEKKDLMSLIQSKMADFSKGHRAIARYIISNYDKASYMTAAVLGKNAGVSESTVVRFATQLGYEGYPEFQAAMSEYVTNRLHMGRRLEIALEDMNPNEILDFVMANDMDNIRSSWEKIDPNALNEAIESILQAKTIYVVGIRSCSFLAEMLAFHLKMICPDVVLVHNSSSTEIFEQMIRVGSEDVVIGISFPRYSMRTIKAMEFANDRSARVITITDNKHSPLNLYSSCNLFAASSMSSVVDSFSAPVSLINVLVVSLCMRRKQEVLQHMEVLEQVWGDYQITDTDELDYFDEEKIKDF